jgi:two-component system, OmpR family, sensor histidine kinase VicK
MEAKSRGVKIRYLTEITQDNIDCCKEIMEIVDEVKHLEGIMSNFMLSESEYLAPIVFSSKEKIATEIIYSNINSFVEQQQYLFDNLWKNAILAQYKIEEIEQGIKADFIETIRDPDTVQRLAFDLVGQAREEILTIFSTANAFRRQTRAGAIQLIKEALFRGVRVRILTPSDEMVTKFIEELELEYRNKSSTIYRRKRAAVHDDHYNDNNNDDYSSNNKQANLVNNKNDDDDDDDNKLKIRFIEHQLQTKVSILIVDRSYSLSVEVKDDAKETSYEAMGLTSYSNSKSTVLSYVSVFESLWTQLDLYEQLKEANKQQQVLIKQLTAHDTLQKEFINIAAHELRTPIQPILGLSDILISKNGNIEQYKEMLKVIGRNAKRLRQLSEDILDVARIESNSLILKIERISLNEIIQGAIDEHESQIRKLKQVNLNLSYKPNADDVGSDIFVKVDKSRLSQVLDNLLNNAIKFTKKGSITIYTTKISNKAENGDEIIISIKDSGIGVEPTVFSKLFDKFITRSHQGTGLGLYISKSIIEAHGGRIWAENNADGKGATFSFSLPVTN